MDTRSGHSSGCAQKIKKQAVKEHPAKDVIEVFSHRTTILNLRAASRKFLPKPHQLFHANCSLRLKHSAQRCGILPQKYRAVKEYALAAASQEANRFQACQEIRFQLRRVELSLCEKRADFIDMCTKYLAGKIRKRSTIPRLSSLSKM